MGGTNEKGNLAGDGGCILLPTECVLQESKPIVAGRPAPHEAEELQSLTHARDLTFRAHHPRVGVRGEYTVGLDGLHRQVWMMMTGALDRRTKHGWVHRIL